MSIDSYLTLAITALAMAALIFELSSPEVVFMAAMTLLMLAGVLTPAEAAAGFGSTTVLIIAALFVLGEGVRRTGVLMYAADLMLGRRKRRREPLIRLMAPVAALSSVLNNTLIVAMIAPAVIDWCKRNDVAPSRMLMPLSFATILGGVCTLIGTSTNLVIDDFMAGAGMAHLSMFELAWVGVPLAAAGIAVMALLSGRLLPERRDPAATLGEERREFIVEMLVEPQSRLVGRTVGEAGLRNLPGLYIVNLEREGRFLGRVSPAEPLRAGDRLVLAGVAASIVELRRFPGLSPAPEAHYDPLAVGRRDHLFEAVVSVSSPLVGITIKDASFRSRYDAAVIAVHRAGRRIPQKIGEIELRAGDTLMIEADASFAERWGNSGDFALVSRMNAEPRPKPSKAPHALVILAAMVTCVAAGWVPILPAVLSAVGLMLAARILTPSEARRSIRISVLVTIAGALALGRALEQTGAAGRVAAGVIEVAGGLGVHGLLALATVIAMAISAFVTNVAAAAIVFPVLVDAAVLAGYDPRPFAIAVAVGCSASFVTPFGYQTNLMIYGPGGYKVTDFLRLGLPLTLIVVIVVAAVVPLAWPPT